MNIHEIDLMFDHNFAVNFIYCNSVLYYHFRLCTKL